MKKTTVLLGIMFFLTIHNFLCAQPGWKLIAPYPTNSALISVSFINGNTGWIAGTGDQILKTTDGGGSWSSQSTQTGKNWSAVCFADAQHGWLADLMGGVYATTDGGSTWSQQAAPSTSYLYAMQFPDATHGFVLPEQDSLICTADGGATWNRIKIDGTQYHYGLKFVNAGEGWICGSEGQILHSVNGGINWAVQSSGTTLDLYAIDFTDNLHGWAAGYTASSHGIILRTSNGGATWETLLQNFDDKILGIAFKDNLNGSAISNSGKIYRTTNGGAAWTAAYTSPHESILGFQVLPSGTGFACGSDGAILKTTNSGDSWSSLYRTASHGYNIRVISFPDQKNGWVLDDAGELMQTSDSGFTWNNRTPFPSSFTTSAAYLNDAARGWVAGVWPAGGYGQILRTTDGGATFNFQLNTGVYPFVSLDFCDSLHGIAGTNNKVIYHTADGGATWESSTVPVAANYMQAKVVRMVDPATGYAILSYVNATALAKTSDGGQTWSVIKTDNTQFTAAYTSISFVDAQHGYLAGFNFNGTPNKFYLSKTDDGGSTWSDIYFPSYLPGNIGTTQINALHFSDMQHGWAAGGGTLSFILYTSDGGTSWSVQELGTTVSWYAMQFIDSQTGFAAGWGGDIIKTTKGGVGVTEIQSEGKDELTVYPNPAGESVVIRYPSREMAKAELKIIDVMGKAHFTATMASSELMLGIAGFPDGIYIIQLADGRRTITKKLVVRHK